MSINVTALTERLVGNRALVESILTALGYHPDEIKFVAYKNILRFRRPDGDNPTAISLFLDNLCYVCFTRPDKGNLYTFIMKTLGVSFPESLKFAANAAGVSVEEYSPKKIRYPFGGFYRNMLPEKKFPELDLPTYPESVFDPFRFRYSKLWNDEGISYKTQEVFGIGMDLDANAILIPERNTAGDLIGIQARRNERNCPHESRWWGYLPCNRSGTLFGYAMNYCRIIEKGVVFIVESEKSVMKAYEMGVQNVVAIGGCRLSEAQIRLLRGLHLSRYILALDEGLPEYSIKLEREKLRIKNPLLKMNVDYIYDRENCYLKNGSKDSPFDHSLTEIKEMLKDCLVKEVS